MISSPFLKNVYYYSIIFFDLKYLLRNGQKGRKIKNLRVKATPKVKNPKNSLIFVDKLDRNTHRGHHSHKRDVEHGIDCFNPNELKFRVIDDPERIQFHLYFL